MIKQVLVTFSLLFSRLYNIIEVVRFMIYLDNCATTKVYKEAMDAALHAFEETYANPSSIHKAGFLLRNDFEEARRVIKNFLKIKSGEIIFTSCASEANNIIVNSIKDIKKKKILTTAVEHQAMNKPIDNLVAHGFEVIKIHPKDGQITLEDVLDNLDDGFGFVSLMHVNNEVGSIIDVESISREVKRLYPDIIFATDAVQAFGKLRIDLSEGNIDFLSMSGHKVHAPKGIGCLYARDMNLVKPLIYGGEQEFSLRAGTENVPGVLALAEAVKILDKNLENNYKYVNDLKNKMIESLKELDGVHLHSEGEGYSPYVLSVAFDNIKAEVLVHILEQDEVYISTSSACSSKQKKHMRVLEGYGYSEKEAEETVRISFSEMNTEDEVLKAAELIKKAVKFIRSVKK